MASASSLYLLLLSPLCTLLSEGQINPHEAQAAPPPPLQLQNLFDHDQNPHMNTKSNQSDNGITKVGLFIAASFGIFALIIVVYCIYNRFYTKQQYQHTQLNDDPDFPSDLSDPPSVFFHGSTFSSASQVPKFRYGSLSDSPSIISVPPVLSPPPCAMPFPPPFLSSHSLRTISARDLQKSCI